MAPDSDSLKQKIQQSSILSSQEKSEWLFLLPKMTAIQVDELTKLLSVRMPPPSSSPPYKGGERVGVVHPSLLPKADIKPAPALPTDVESLKQINIEAMRKAPSVYLFLEELGKKMKDMVASRRASGETVRQAFEQSPLHRAYVSAGLKLMGGGESEILNHAEFEALADFRASLRKTLS